jgi:hypothetical protein
MRLQGRDNITPAFILSEGPSVESIPLTPTAGLGHDSTIFLAGRSDDPAGAIAQAVPAVHDSIQAHLDILGEWLYRPT